MAEEERLMEEARLTETAAAEEAQTKAVEVEKLQRKLQEAQVGLCNCDCSADMCTRTPHNMCYTQVAIGLQPC